MPLFLVHLPRFVRGGAFVARGSRDHEGVFDIVILCPSLGPAYGCDTADD